MSKIRVHKIHEKSVVHGGLIKVSFPGNREDAEYIRKLLHKINGVSVKEPFEEPGTVGMRWHLVARGTRAEPLSKSTVVELLSQDPHLEMPPDPTDR